MGRLEGCRMWAAPGWGAETNALSVRAPRVLLGRAHAQGVVQSPAWQAHRRKNGPWPPTLLCRGAKAGVPSFPCRLPFSHHSERVTLCR